MSTRPWAVVSDVTMTHAGNARQDEALTEIGRPARCHQRWRGINPASAVMTAGVSPDKRRNAAHDKASAVTYRAREKPY